MKRVVGAVLTLGLLGSFSWARTHHIYREPAGSMLASRLDDVWPGGRGLRTNARTYQFLAGLQEAVRIAEGLGPVYAIIPDCPGYWVKADRPNPLCIDWPQYIELNDQRLVNRVTSQLEALRGEVVVIVQKCEAESLDHGLVPLIDRYEIVRFVRARFQKVRDLNLFEIYK